MERLDAEGRLHFTSRGGIRRKRYLDEMPGRQVQQLWADIAPINSQAQERTGYPTQKPLPLYERIIHASSNPGDVVLDPFCGCATTPIAAERLGRQWVGMDIWDGAHQMVLDRLESYKLAVKSRRGLKAGQQMLAFRDITYSTHPPERTDNTEPAPPVLNTPMGSARDLRRQRHPPPRSQHVRLIADLGPFCQGCGADYRFDPRVLEVDHIRPRSDGGSDIYDNLTLLCPPCNREKRDRYTLAGLQELNRERGHMKPGFQQRIIFGRGTTLTRRRRR